MPAEFKSIEQIKTENIGMGDKVNKAFNTGLIVSIEIIY